MAQNHEERDKEDNYWSVDEETLYEGPIPQSWANKTNLALAKAHFNGLIFRG